MPIEYKHSVMLNVALMEVLDIVLHAYDNSIPVSANTVEQVRDINNLAKELMGLGE